MSEFSYSDYIVFRVHMEKAKRSSQKQKRKRKVIWEKSQNFIELLPSAQPTEMKILSFLVKISWKTELPRSVLFHMKTRVYLKYLVNDFGFFAGWASFQYELINSATYILFYSKRINLKTQQTPKKDSILSGGN